MFYDSSKQVANYVFGNMLGLVPVCVLSLNHYILHDHIYVSNSWIIVLTFLDQFSFGVFLFSQLETHKELLCNLKNLVIALVKSHFFIC